MGTKSYVYILLRAVSNERFFRVYVYADKMSAYAKMSRFPTVEMACFSAYICRDFFRLFETTFYSVLLSTKSDAGWWYLLGMWDDWGRLGYLRAFSMSTSFVVAIIAGVLLSGVMFLSRIYCSLWQRLDRGLRYNVCEYNMFSCFGYFLNAFQGTKTNAWTLKLPHCYI